MRHIVAFVCTSLASIHICIAREYPFCFCSVMSRQDEVCFTVQCYMHSLNLYTTNLAVFSDTLCVYSCIKLNDPKPKRTLFPRCYIHILTRCHQPSPPSLDTHLKKKSCTDVTHDDYHVEHIDWLGDVWEKTQGVHVFERL